MILTLILIAYFSIGSFMLGFMYCDDDGDLGKTFYNKVQTIFVTVFLGGIICVIAAPCYLWKNWDDSWAIKGWIEYFIDKKQYTGLNHEGLIIINEKVYAIHYKNMLKRKLNIRLLEKINKLNNYTHKTS